MVFGVVLLIFALFAVAIIWRPATVLGLAICIYPFEQWAQANSGFFAAHAAFINYGLGVLTLFAVAMVTFRGRNPLNPMTGTMWIWMAMYVFAGVSCLWSLDRNLSIFLFKYHAPYVITFVALMPMVIQKPEDLRIGLITTLFFGSIVMLLLLVGTHVHAWGRTIEAGAAIIDRTGQQRTRLAPLAVAETAGQIMLIAVLMNFTGVSRIWQFLRWGVALLALALIYRSGSRGQLIAAIFAALMYLTLSRGTKKVYGWIAAGVSSVVILTLVAVSFATFAGKSGSRWSLETMEKTFSSTRLDYATTLFSYWADSSPMNWLFGLGSSASYDNRILGFYCHVVPVEILCELGLFGFMMMLAFLTLVGRDGLRLYGLTKKDDIDRGVTVTLLALFTFQCIIALKQGSFLTHTFTLACGLFISRQAVILRMRSRQERKKSMLKWYQQYYAGAVGTGTSAESAAAV